MFEIEHQYSSPIASEGSHGSSLHPRLAWMICYKETGSVQTVCKKFGISRKTFYKWLKRFNESNSDSGSLTDQSRRPHHFPRATSEAHIQLLKKLRDETGYGQRRLKMCLMERYNISLSERTIWKILKRIEIENGANSDSTRTPGGAVTHYFPARG